MDTDKGSKHHTFPLESRVFEVEKEGYAQFANSQIIEHLSALGVGDAINDFGIDYNRTEGQQIWNELANHLIPEQNRESLLLFKWNRTTPERNRKRVFVNLLMESMPDFVEHFEGTAEDLPRLFF